MWTRCALLLGIVGALVGAVQTQQPQTYGSGVSLTAGARRLKNRIGVGQVAVTTLGRAPSAAD